MTEYLCHVTFGISIQAESREEAQELAEEFENSVWTMIQDNVEVWESEVSE